MRMRRQIWLAVTLCFGSAACSPDKEKDRAVDAGATGGGGSDSTGNTERGADASGRTDAPDADIDGATGSAGDGGTRGADGGRVLGDGGNLCVPGEVVATRTTPKILILMDKSGSMVWPGCAAAGDPVGAGCPTPSAPYDKPFDRWIPSVQALKSTTAAFEDSVRFGLMVFPSPALPGDLPPLSTVGCQPGKVSVEPALNAADEIALVLDSEVADGDSTPIPGSLRAAHEALGAATPSTDASRYVLLITDGAPNCMTDGTTAPAAPDAAQDTYAELDSLTTDGIRTYVVGYDTDTNDETAAVMDEMARRGGTGETKHRLVKDQKSLDAAISAVLDRAGQCAFDLDTTVGNPDYLRVTLDDKLRVEGADGWQLTDGKVLELRGEACKELGNLKVKHTLEVRVDCEP